MEWRRREAKAENGRGNERARSTRSGERGRTLVAILRAKNQRVAATSVGP